MTKLDLGNAGGHEGLADVEIDSKEGYIDKIGRYVWKPTR
jgi:hypothetical protein